MAQPEENYKGWERLSAKKLLIERALQCYGSETCRRSWKRYQNV